MPLRDIYIATVLSIIMAFLCAQQCVLVDGGLRIMHGRHWKSPLKWPYVGARCYLWPICHEYDYRYRKKKNKYYVPAVIQTYVINGVPTCRSIFSEPVCKSRDRMCTWKGQRVFCKDLLLRYVANQWLWTRDTSRHILYILNSQRCERVTLHKTRCNAR